MSHDPLPYTRVWLKAGLGDPAGRPPLGCMAEEGWLGALETRFELKAARVGR